MFNIPFQLYCRITGAVFLLRRIGDVVIRNYDAAQVAKTEEAEAYSDLLRESTRRITTGTLYTDVPGQGWFNIREGVEQ